MLKSLKTSAGPKRKSFMGIPRKSESTTSIADYSSQMLSPGAVFEAFRMTNNDLQLSSIDVNHSGTTFVMVLVVGRQFICANVGDSRAIVGSYERDWRARAISRDHKPDADGECERIVMANGVVKEWQDFTGKPHGPKRVWKRGEDYPGLAMSRSFGDKEAEVVGVVWTPDIVQEALGKDDKVVVLASDGVWDQMSNEEVIRTVGKYWWEGEAALAADELVREARSRWETEDEDVADDTTAIVIFLR
eukprot:TRINITY_DN12088_c0_g6_i2.p2 TRINITY_DN12088_c0_g6~~TRINITY_DN12088_c0_g6_i2.p2  ORF type:complete len:247 (-),score=67.89 TRINITY_DN12088_c0_g6_i2:1067-1807(-)